MIGAIIGDVVGSRFEFHNIWGRILIFLPKIPFLPMIP